MNNTATKQAESYFENLAKALEIPPSRYEQADKSYKALGKWLHRDESRVSSFDPDVFAQGSFSMGTVVKPLSADEQYDVDCACVLTKLDKSEQSQADLKKLFGKDIEAYRKANGMTKKLKESRRCWTLEHAEGAQFHMDIVPAIPNGDDQRLLLEARNLDAEFAETAIAITDNEVSNYNEITDEWPRSNPRGYLKWFTAQMGDAFAKRREDVLLEMKSEGVTASIEDIPVYRVRTPLQSVIMVLKRHRDMMFSEDGTDKPISIIITSLAAHAYNNEQTIGSALLSILSRMDSFIQYDGTKYTIENPTDATENFADKWEEYPERAQEFFRWLEQAREDFGSAGLLAESRRISSVLAERMGSDATNKAAEATLQVSHPDKPGLLGAATAASATTPHSVSFADSPRTPKKPDGFA